MARRLFSNNAYGAATGVIGPTATSFQVSGDYVENFPAPSVSDLVMITVQGLGDEIEIMQLTARSGGNFTVIRAQEGTLAQSFPADSLVELRATAQALNGFGQLDNDELLTGTWGSIQAPTQYDHLATKGYVDDIFPVGAVWLATSGADPNDGMFGVWEAKGTQVLGTITANVWERMS